jgi:hypothetical protein
LQPFTVEMLGVVTRYIGLRDEADQLLTANAIAMKRVNET